MNREYLLSLVLLMVSASMRAWILSSTSTAQSHTWMSPLLLLSLATRLWSLQPAPDQDIWPKELKRANSTDTHTSTSSLSGRPGPHARKFISNLMRDADNPLHLPSGTPGQVSKVCSTVPSPNNNSQPPTRDLSRPQSLLCSPRVESC